jgi:branched-subunit amino acid transport protein
MSHLLLILLVAGITFATRASFMLKITPSRRIQESRFLEVFPITLFIALASRDLMAPGGEVAITPALAAAAGGIIGGLVFRRSILGVVGTGLALYWLARLLIA